MYNRYIPQPDGSFRRSRQPDALQNDPPSRPQPSKAPSSPAPVCDSQAPREQPPLRQNPPCSRPHPPRPNRTPPPRPQSPLQQNPEHGDFLGIGHFLRQLLPRDFDAEDLLVVLLLLLMTGDSGEDSHFALLTLGLYLFM